MSDLISVRTLWIDHCGSFADPFENVGRLGEDVTVFTIHTLGWARVMEIGGFAEIQFDIQAANETVVSAVVAYAEGWATRHAPWLVQIEVYDGVHWQRLVTHDLPEAESFMSGLAPSDALPVVPSAIAKRKLSDSVASDFPDPALRSLNQAWIDCGGRMDLDSVLELVSRQSAEVQIITQLDDGRFAFIDQETSMRAQADGGEARSTRSVQEVIPDRGYAADIERSCTRFWDRLEVPSCEHWSGPVRTTSGIRDLDWIRVTFPIFRDETASLRDGHRTEMLIVVCLPAPLEYQSADKVG